MKFLHGLKIGIVVLFCLGITSNSYAWFRWFSPGVPDISKDWIEIDPAIVYPDFEYNGLTPACTGCPTCDSDKFTFFAKGGATNKLVIYFQGGGACWDSTNCLYFPTYTQQQMETLEMFADTDILLNPFKNWYFVYIPYCTGDIHWGAKDMA